MQRNDELQSILERSQRRVRITENAERILQIIQPQFRRQISLSVSFLKDVRRETPLLPITGLRQKDALTV